MCMGGGGGGGYRPPAKPRWLQDTSNEIVVSKYELSEKNKAKNARIRASLIRRPTIQIDNGGGDDHSPSFSGSKGWDGNASGQSSAGSNIGDAMSAAASAQSGGGLKGTDFDGGSNKGGGFAI